jgi:steroid delta-isomerase-like uncharacterized protein
MSRTATEHLIKAYIEASNKGDNAAILAMLHEDVVFDMSPATPETQTGRQPGRQIGVEAFKWQRAATAAHFKEQLADAVVLSSEDGMHGAAELTWRGAYVATIAGLPKASGQRFSMRAALFFEVEDGKITRLTSYRDRTEWLRQIAQD